MIAKLGSTQVFIKILRLTPSNIRSDTICSLNWYFFRINNFWMM